MVATVEDVELTDPEVSAERLLYRLFHERGVRVFEPLKMVERCRCSRERVGRMLVNLGRDEIDSVVQERGHIEISCDFCGAQYDFDSVDVGELFTPLQDHVPGPDSVQ